jgi:hypothetical protein
MSRASNPLVGLLQDCLGQANFHRKGKTWSFADEEVVQLVNLQKSQWGNQYYINFAIWLNRLGQPPKDLREHQCHIRLRASALLDDDTLLKQALDLENQLDDRTRSEALKSILCGTLMPFAPACRTLDGLREVYREGRLKGMIAKDVRDLLDS